MKAFRLTVGGTIKSQKLHNDTLHFHESFKTSIVESGKILGRRGLEMAGEDESADAQAFNEREMDKIIRQIVDKVRRNYFENGETARGMPSEVKRIIEANLDHV